MHTGQHSCTSQPPGMVACMTRGRRQWRQQHPCSLDPGGCHAPCLVCESWPHSWCTKTQADAEGNAPLQRNPAATPADFTHRMDASRTQHTWANNTLGGLTILGFSVAMILLKFTPSSANSGGSAVSSAFLFTYSLTAPHSEYCNFLFVLD